MNDADEQRDDRQEARDGRQEARDDSQEARDDRQDARDERAQFTRDDLDPLAVQVDALRQDLAAYRWAIEKILRRRLWTSVAAAVVGVGVLVALGLGSLALLNAEEERARQTLELARLDSCANVRVLQGQVVAVLANLPDRPGPEPEWLGAALDRLSVDPCGGGTAGSGGGG